MAITETQFLDLRSVTPDAHFWAGSILKGSKRKLLGAPSRLDLAESILSIVPESHLKGSGLIVVTLQDENWSIVDSGFFDPNADGRLEEIDVNWPEGSDRWWRLTTVSVRSDHSLTLTFMNRIVAKLMGLYGPVKAARSSKTRAEFLKMVAARVPEIRFFCAQLDLKQAVAAADSTSSSSQDGAKAAGVGANSKGLTCKGVQLNARQIAVVNAALSAANKLQAPENAMVALIYAGMGESSLGGDADAGGNVWQANNPGNYAGDEGMATAFLKGTGDFRAPGGIGFANQGHPVWQIANEVEANDVWNKTRQDSYAHQFSGGQAEGLSEAKAIVQAGGGAAGKGSLGPGTTTETVQAYNFEIGTTDSPFETLWDGMVRIAGEVGWELVADGQRLYYDADTTLIRQKVAAVIGRDDPAVVDGWAFDWETRGIATTFSLPLICDPFEFHAGEVVQLHGFGAASTGSTAKQPGKWLIGDVAGAAGSVVQTFSLVQPAQPLLEPAASTSSSADTGSAGGTGSGTAAAALAAAKTLSDLGLPYSKSYRQLTVPPPSGGYDCSASVAWVLWQAGMYSGPTGWAWVSGTMAAQWGQPGRGKYMTLWANEGHVFLEFTPDGGAHQQGNTDVPGQDGFRLVAWGPNGDSGVASGAYTPRRWPGQ